MLRMPQVLDPRAVRPRKGATRGDQFLDQMLGRQALEGSLALPAAAGAGGFQRPQGPFAHGQSPSMLSEVRQLSGREAAAEAAARSGAIEAGVQQQLAGSSALLDQQGQVLDAMGRGVEGVGPNEVRQFGGQAVDRLQGPASAYPAQGESSPLPMELQYDAATIRPAVDQLGSYADGVGPQMRYTSEKPAYQAKGRDVGAGYLNNPFDEQGRTAIGRQFWQAPLGGHLRSALSGQEVFGHTITGGQARMAEQAAAGALAVGVGVPALMAAANQLNNPQTPGTMPMV